MSSIWLRSETKAHEKRTPLTPKNAKKLIDKGIEVFVEEFPDRIFPIKQYEEVGCTIVPEGSWKTADTKHYILGLKEIEQKEDFRHKHIYFAHVFKGQDGSKEILSQYKNGGGTLFDLEYLTNEQGRRIAAFGFWAGFVGAAVGLKGYYFREKQSTSIPAISSVNDQEILISELIELSKKSTSTPKAIVIGAKGRCGQGASSLFEKVGIQVTKWDIEETKKGGPFKEIPEHEIFVNTVLMQVKIPPFISTEIISKESKLKIISDVSCDPNSDLNPIPLYDKITSWDEPFVSKIINDHSLDILAVDNLPSLLPKESSEDFSDQLFPHLENLLLGKGEEDIVWRNAKDVFLKKRN